MKPKTGLTDSNRLVVADELAKILADEYVLYTKTKNAHWNVEGADFFDKHTFFDSQAKQLNDIVDRVAERIRALGHFVPGSLKAFLELTHFTEAKENGNDSATYLKELLGDHESLIIRIREIIPSVTDRYKDAGSADFMTGLMEEHEKMAWFIRSHLK